MAGDAREGRPCHTCFTILSWRRRESAQTKPFVMREKTMNLSFLNKGLVSLQQQNHLRGARCRRRCCCCIVVSILFQRATYSTLTTPSHSQSQHTHKLLSLYCSRLERQRKQQANPTRASALPMRFWNETPSLRSMTSPSAVNR